MRKQVFVILLVMVVSVSLFAGARAQGPQAGGSITEITHIVWDRGTIPAIQGTLLDNWWTRYVNEKIAHLGAKISYIAIPRPQEAQLLSTMLAANNAPDISKTNEIPLLKTYLTGGGVADITGYVDRFGPNIKALLGPEVIEDIKYDNKLYWIPHMQNGIESRTTWIRKDWLDAVNLDTPSTPEEFYNVLKVIKEKDPGRRGASLIPLAIPAGANNVSINPSFSNYDSVGLPGFIKEPLTPEKLLTPIPMWPEYKEAFRFLNRLYAEGLITDAFITDRDESLFRQNIARGDVFAFINFGHYPYHSAYGGLYDRLRETDAKAVLANVSTFRSSKTASRMEYRETNPVYGYRFFVPASSRNVELAVKVLDFLSSEEGYLVGGLGILDQDYTMVNNVPTPINRDSYLARVPWIEPQYGLMAKPYTRPQDKLLFLENYIKDFNPVYYDQIRAEANYLSDITAFPPTISAPTPVSDKQAPIIRDFWAEEIVKAVFASPVNFDRIFDDAVKEYKTLGGDDIAAEALRLYAQQRR